MGLLTLPVLIPLLAAAYLQPSGVLWSAIVVERPENSSHFLDILIQNTVLYIILYGAAHILFYVEPQRNLFKPFKFNSAYPPAQLVRAEALRSLRGVCVASCWEWLVYRAYAAGSLPWGAPLGAWLGPGPG